jgi:hypothetical protein
MKINRCSSNLIRKRDVKGKAGTMLNESIQKNYGPTKNTSLIQTKVCLISTNNVNPKNNSGHTAGVKIATKYFWDKENLPRELFGLSSKIVNISL